MQHVNEQKGSKVKPTDRTVNAPSMSKTGRFAALCGLLRVKGIGAPSYTSAAVAPAIEPDPMLPDGQPHAGWVSAEDQCPRSVGESDKVHRETWKAECERRRGQGALRRLLPVSLLTVLGALAFTAAPALAFETPEKPEVVTPAPIWASTATLHGVLDRGKAGGPFEMDMYEFVYKQSKMECKGAGEVKTTEEPSLGEGHQEVSEPISSLKANSEYTVCLVTRNTEATPEEAVSAPVTFKTKVATKPEEPTATEATEVKATEAKLEGVVNPGAEGEAGKYQFLYKQTASLTECTGESETPKEAVSGGAAQPVSVLVGSLKAGKPYTFCVKAFNALGEATVSKAVHFETPAPPQTPVTEAAIVESASAATLKGELNPGGKATTGYHFLYNTTGACAGGGETQQVTPVEIEKETKVEAKKVEGLQPHTKYTVCLVATNSAGETAQGSEVSFETLAAGLSIDSESASNVKSTSAKLEAQINPNNEKTTYAFEYSTEASGETLKGTVVKRNGASALEGYGDQTASVETGASLAQDTTYYYRVTAENAQSKGVLALGKVQSFTTVPTAVTDPATEVSASTAIFNGHFTRDALPTTYSFDYKANPADPAAPGECEGESATTPTEAGTGSETVSEPTQVTGLTPGTPYAVCLVTSNKYGSETGPVVAFATPAVGAPAAIVGSYFETEVTGDSAELHVQIDPNGAETTYSFQYGPSTTYGQSTPPAALGATDDGAHPAQALLQNLTPGTTYHYRVVATHAGEPAGTPGPDHTFTTQTQGAEFTLPDNRAWEMVSPVDKYGARIAAITKEGGVIQAAEDGSAFMYVTSSPPVTNPEGNPALAESQIIATHGPGGWSSRDIATPHEEAIYGPPLDYFDEYKAFSPDLSSGVVEPEHNNVDGLSPLSAQAPEAQVYLREGLRESTGARYAPLVNSSNAPLGRFEGASSNLEHLILSGNEWTNGVATPAFVLPNGEDAGGEQGGSLGYQDRNVKNAVSENGQRVFFEAKVFNGHLSAHFGELHLFMRDLPEEKTVQVDLPQGVASPNHPEKLYEVAFQYATPDGEKVFFTSEYSLTPEAKAGYGGELYYGESELYEYNTVTGVLTDVAPDPSPTASTGVQTGLVQVSEQGEYVYFVANGSLDGAPAGDCNGYRSSPKDTCNLYVAHLGGQKPNISFVATLSGADYHDWITAGGQNEEFNPRGITSRVSPDGRYFAFMSQRSLTGYDNTDVNEHPTKYEEQEEGVSAQTKVKHQDEEVFVYDALTKHLTCASCDPTGARPHGVFDTLRAGEGLGLLVDRPQIWKNRWLAGSIPGWTSYALAGALYQSRYLSDEGRLFFDSADSLVPQDTNGKEDVYEYEPEGRDCASGSVSASEAYEPASSVEIEGGKVESGGGCVALISSGSSSTESAFLDASGKGPGGEESEDVFFLTASKLVAQDLDSAYDVYDAHVCSTVAPCTSLPVSSPPCATADSCRVAPAAQPSLYGAPSSATFSGAGNAAAPAVVKKTTKKLVRCEKGFTKNKRHRCVRTKRKQQTKRSSNDRRAR
jgi:hypothetical protein